MEQGSAAGMGGPMSMYGGMGGMGMGMVQAPLNSGLIIGEGEAEGEQQQLGGVYGQHGDGQGQGQGQMLTVMPAPTTATMYTVL